MPNAIHTKKAELVRSMKAKLKNNEQIECNKNMIGEADAPVVLFIQERKLFIEPVFASNEEKFAAFNQESNVREQISIEQAQQILESIAEAILAKEEEDRRFDEWLNN